MNANAFRYVYGPVPSRRLGRSLGIDLVPFKTCSYDCGYCQLGRTTNKTLERKEYVAVDEVLAELERKLAQDTPDYITLSGSGEPTLNSRIGDLIRTAKDLTHTPLAVLTNGSLLWMPEVQDALMPSDLVLPSLDAGDERLFRYVNRPHRGISFERMVDGLVSFTKRFQGEVWLEVLLLDGLTGVPSEVEKIAALTQRIAPARVQLNTVSRPPSDQFALPVATERLHALKQLFPIEVDVIAEGGPEASRAPARSDAADAEILALLSRRPCTSADVANGLSIHVAEALKRLDGLLADGKVSTVVTGGRTFYAASSAEDASTTPERDAEQ
jgi:wyosine [tRNA(Phe)-imidazoG37] synthetase (radical SAM superfamily)